MFLTELSTSTLAILLGAFLISMVLIYRRYKYIPIFSARVHSHLFCRVDQCHRPDKRWGNKFDIPAKYKRFYFICYESNPEKPDFRVQYHTQSNVQDIGYANSMKEALIICKQHKL